ncbi:hypothetical protein [Mariniluteicoccus flavus]
MRAADLGLPAMRAAEIFGPVPYAHHWLWLGIALAVLAVAWPVLVWLLTRPRRVRPTPPAPPRTPAQALAEAQSGIRAVRARHAVGEVTDRGAHQELSRVVRRFVAEASGWPTDHMGLADLREAMQHDARLANLTDYVAVLHPPSFGPDGAGDVDAAADRADELVRRWATALEEVPA